MSCAMGRHAFLLAFVTFTFTASALTATTHRGPDAFADETVSMGEASGSPRTDAQADDPSARMTSTLSA